MAGSRTSDGASIAPDPITSPEEVFTVGDGVTVQAGAVIETARFGSAVLLGHNVVNEGRISATDGQVLLAEGRAIDPEEDVVKRRTRAVRRHFGEKPIGYPPWLPEDDAPDYDLQVAVWPFVQRSMGIPDDLSTQLCPQ